MLTVQQPSQSDIGQSRSNDSKVQAERNLNREDFKPPVIEDDPKDRPNVIKSRHHHIEKGVQQILTQADLGDPNRISKLKSQPVESAFQDLLQSNPTQLEEFLPTSTAAINSLWSQSLNYG